MTDRALVEKKLATIVSAVSDLRRLARVELLRHDVREERFIEHTLQLVIGPTPPMNAAPDSEWSERRPGG